MEKECCDIRVTETDDGFRIDIKGENVKSKCMGMMDNCCSEDMMKKWFQSCCKPEK